MGWFDDAVDWVEDTATEVYDDVVDEVEQVVEQVQDVVDDYVPEAASDWFGGLATGAAEWAGQAASDAGDWFGSAVDDYVFDTVDYLSGGAVNIDYDDGNFSAQVGIDGVATGGISFGEDGFEASGKFDVGIASGELSYGDGGFNASGSAGVDWGPLPYVEGHVDISENGDIDVGGQVQGTIPTPYGIVSGSAEGGFNRGADGSWGANVAADGTLITATGTTIGGNLGIGYQEAADGDSSFNVGVGASVGYVGGPEVSAGVGYSHTEIDGVTTDSVDTEVGFEGYGFEASASAGYDRVEDAEGNVMQTVSTEVEGSGYGVTVNASGEYERIEDTEGNVRETYSGETGASGYGMAVQGGGEYSETTLADGTSTSSSDTWVDVDGLDAEKLLSFATEAIGGGEGGGGEGAAGMLGQVQSVVDQVSEMAGTGNLSDALGSMADEAGSSIADVAGNLADSGNFDDFQSDVIESEVTEAAADEVWDDLGS